MYRPIVDGDGKEGSSLFGSNAPLNDFDVIDKSVYWESVMDTHDDKYSGEALVNHEFEQRCFNNSDAVFLI